MRFWLLELDMSIRAIPEEERTRMPERDYLSSITEIISTIRATQKESIDKAAEAFARSIVSGGRAPHGRAAE